MKISNGNSKIGKIPNMSFPPILSCRPDAPCKDKCYAVKAWRMYKPTRDAWTENFEEYKAAPTKFFKYILSFIIYKEPEFFRWFVAGDIPDIDFFDRMVELCRETPDTTHLVFTKRYDLDLDISNLPKNLHLFLSEWPGIEIPEKYSSLRVAHFETPIGHECNGECTGCMFCFKEEDGDVYFHAH